jgi:hypothetical protein
MHFYDFVRTTGQVGQGKVSERLSCLYVTHTNLIEIYKKVIYVSQQQNIMFIVAQF